MILGFFRAWLVLLYPRAWLTMVFALGVTIVILALLWLFLFYGLSWLEGRSLPLINDFLTSTGIDWIDTSSISHGHFSEWFGSVMWLLLVWLLFPIIFVAGLSLFLEMIVNKVEQKSYPSLPASLPVPLSQSLKDTFCFLGVIFLWNLFAFLFYLILPLGAAFIYLGVNGFLISQEHMRLIAVRRIPAPKHVDFVKTHRVPALIVGICTATFLLVPGINLIASMIGVAWMTHLFHSLHNSSEAHVN